MLGKQFPNAFKNQESMICEEFITKKLLRCMSYLRRRKQQKLNQGGSLRQNYGACLQMSNQRKIRFGIHPDRYSLDHLLVGETIKTQDQITTVLKFLYLQFNSKHVCNINWDQIKEYNIIFLSYNNYL